METLGSFLVIVLLTMAGAGAPDSGPHPVSLSCDGYTQDACVTTPHCDVFPATDGTTSCLKACDLRATASSCEADGACSWDGTSCDYPTSLEPIGC